MSRIIGVTSYGEELVELFGDKMVSLHVQDLNGDVHYMDVREIDFHAYEDGELIQNCFPYLTPEQRELIITGMTDEMWMDNFNEIENECK